MRGSILAVQYVAFVAFGLIASVAQARFLRLVMSRDPGAISSDDDVLYSVGRRPTRFISIMAGATRQRLAALFARSPHPEVERARRWALLWIGLALVTFLWLVLRPGG
jgi:hypothetical protein